jgi:hypothetical protein
MLLRSAQQLKQLSPLDSRSDPAPTATLARSSLRAGSRTRRVGWRAVRRPRFLSGKRPPEAAVKTVAKAATHGEARAAQLAEKNALDARRRQKEAAASMPPGRARSAPTPWRS